jgi:TetR/AcrR family fatty acid metabolism transcriptional regulator
VSDVAEVRTVNEERTRKRRERILDAAFHVFSRTGYRDAAVDEIAREADTSKGGIYFHFPSKESIFVELLHSTADRLIAKVERSVADERDPVAQADAAIGAVLAIFAGHRSMARLLLIDGLGAGTTFRVEILRLHDRFADLIASYLDRAVDERAIPGLDTHVAGAVWFGAIHEVVVRWLVSDRPAPLEDAHGTLRALLLRGVGVPEARIVALAER